MKDYFKEFLLPPSAGGLPNPTTVASSLSSYLNSTDASTPIKTHLIWAGITGSGIFLSWKISEFWTRYKIIRDKVPT